MSTMYSNLTSSQALPLAFRVSSQPASFFKHLHSKSQYLPIGSQPKPPLSLNPLVFNFAKNGHKIFNFSEPRSFSAGICCKSIEISSLAKPRSMSSVFSAESTVEYCVLSRPRGFSSSFVERNRVSRIGKLPTWLKSKKVKESRGLGKLASTNTSRSSWEESAERLENMSNSNSSWEESAKRLDKVTTTKIGHSSWEESARKKVSRNRIVGMPKNYQNGSIKSDRSIEEEEEADVVDDQRFDKFKNRFRGDTKAVSEKPEFRKWNKQENFGRKTWKESTGSTVPKMIGEGLYGVGPVLAALSAGRREFNVLYVQEGLFLNSNNKKRKDKKGFEKVLKMAENIGISIKEISKHDLNMVADNRPHQGLVLDASPLEMVKIKELDPISSEEDQGSLWVALDEVTDPQNLGAIVRSAYFFGASGVVLCAKNSAPLSGVVSKASAGSLELLELRYCNNMMQFLISSAENGWRVLGGSVSSKAIALNEIPPGPPTILVLGSEGTGLRPLVERSCTHLVRIPGNIPIDVTAQGVGDMAANVSSAEHFHSFMAVESLNVSVAAGVLLHHLIGHHQNNNSLIGDNSAETLD